MMVLVDASALVALALDEDEAWEFGERLKLYEERVTMPLSVWEAAMAISRETETSLSSADAGLDSLMRNLDIRPWGVPPEVRRHAIEAHERFGKGRHPARLNFGDCFAYACARLWDAKLLFKGDDFALTDVRAA